MDPTMRAMRGPLLLMVTLLLLHSTQAISEYRITSFIWTPTACSVYVSQRYFISFGWSTRGVFDSIFLCMEGKELIDFIQGKGSGIAVGSNAIYIYK